MKKHVLAAFALMLAATPALAGENHDGKGPGRHFEKVDTNKDGKISREEMVAKSNRMFDKVDADKDGFVSREEGQKFHEARKAKWKAHREEMKKQAEQGK